MTRSVAILCAVVFCFSAAAAEAHSPFGKALKEKYEVRRVSCYTCHKKSDEVLPEEEAAYEAEKKSVRDAFGQEVFKHMEGQDWSKKLADAKGTDDEDAVEAEAVKAFLVALEKAAQAKSDGKTYDELIKSGELDGITKE